MEEKHKNELYRQAREAYDRKVLADATKRLHEWMSIPTTVLPEVRPEWLRRT